MDQSCVNYVKQWIQNDSALAREWTLVVIILICMYYLERLSKEIAIPCLLWYFRVASCVMCHTRKKTKDWFLWLNIFKNPFRVWPQCSFLFLPDPFHTQVIYLKLQEAMFLCLFVSVFIVSLHSQHQSLDAIPLVTHSQLLSLQPYISTWLFPSLCPCGILYPSSPLV